MVAVDVNKIFRQDRRLRNNGIWCNTAQVISETMHEKHGLDLLSPVKRYRLALRLKKQETPFDIMNLSHTWPSNAAIKEKLDSISNSIKLVSDFSKIIKSIENKSENNLRFDTEDRKYKAALEFLADHARIWEKDEREKYARERSAWDGMTSDKRRSELSKRPIDRLSGHVQPPEYLKEGITLYHADLMIKRWIEQTIFVNEIMKNALRGANEKEDEKLLSPYVYLASEWAPNLYRRTYGRSTLGNPGRDGSYKNAAGYTFVSLALKAVTGRAFAANSIRTYIATAKKASKE
jgi:hypothetical protein